MKKVIASVAILAMFLTGCGGVDGTGGKTEYVEVVTPNGPVGCIFYDGGSYAGGIDCNWPVDRS